MNKLQVCMNFALGFVHPEHINTRAGQYTAIKKAMDNLQQRWLANWEQLPCLQKVDGKYSGQLQALRGGLAYLHQDGQRYLALMEAEAEAGNRYGNTQARSVDYAQALQIEALWQEKCLWSMQQVESIQQGVVAAKGLRRQLRRGGIVVDAACQQELEGMISVMLVQEDADKLPQLEAWQRTGVVTGRYAGMTAEMMSLWQSRLEWVRQVTGTSK
jgi:hypothetical protein